MEKSTDIEQDLVLYCVETSMNVHLAVRSILLSALFSTCIGPVFAQLSKPARPYVVVDTGQDTCYDTKQAIRAPRIGKLFYGQDAQYRGPQFKLVNNRNGTVSDHNTGLMWTQDPGEKMTYVQALAAAKVCRVGGYDDWRVPSIKELYSLMDFRGQDPSSGRLNSRPFLDGKIFKFKFGDPKKGERVIDSQFATSSVYGGVTMGYNKTMFGVNFADGRIKGYPLLGKTFFVLFVRGNKEYGKNKFKDNGDGTVTDEATGLMWMQVDSDKLGRKPMDWPTALQWSENLIYAGHRDWRMPNAKELQSIVDYSRCPQVNGTAAIDPVFHATKITNEGGGPDFHCYWTSTTHASTRGGSKAAYVSFGNSLGWLKMPPYYQYVLLDVHGAGAQRSDPKIGDPSLYPTGWGPQGDVIRIYNSVRCVRNAR